jgi:hypothetical protein
MRPRQIGLGRNPIHILSGDPPAGGLGSAEAVEHLLG